MATGQIEREPAVQDFVIAAREGTARFHDLEEAIRKGYSPFGPDMPNMGEHWVHLQLAMSRELDPARPAVLTYLRTDGQPVLTGVAYTYAALPGEEPPEFLFEDAWHFHAGSVEEEAYGISHADQKDVSRTRLGMIHAWLWLPNPMGVFTASNWSLPYVRLGLPVPPDVDEYAARSLALAAGWKDYYGRAVELAAPGEIQHHAIVRAVLDRAAVRVQELVADARPLAPSADALAGVWYRLWNDVRRDLPADVWSRVSVLAPPSD